MKSQLVGCLKFAKDIKKGDLVVRLERNFLYEIEVTAVEPYTRKNGSSGVNITLENGAQILCGTTATVTVKGDEP